MKLRLGVKTAAGCGARSLAPKKLFSLMMSISSYAPPARDFYLGLVKATGGRGVAEGEGAGDLLKDSGDFSCFSFGPAEGFFSGTADYALSPLRALSLLDSAEELERVFSEIAEALRPGGLFAFDLDNAFPSGKCGEGTMRVVGAARLPSGMEVLLSESRSLLPGGRKLFCRIGVEELESSGKVGCKSYHTLALLTLSKKRILEMAGKCGFCAEGVFGGFRMEPLESSSPTQLWLFRKG
jgi:hypothetical protein